MNTQIESQRPLVLSPSEHPIRKEQIDRDALFVLRRLNEAGYASYLVGGGVRDLYLNKKPRDFDIGTDARPGQLRKLFPNSRTIGRRFRLVQVFFPRGKIVEVSTLRSLSEFDMDGPEAVLAPNNTYGTLDEDALRRDLTINALFYEIENRTIIDYVGGVSDLEKAVIRIIGDPEKRINRDPVRMLRAIRHSVRNDFSIDPESWNAIRNNGSKLGLCPRSRLRDEVLKDIYSGVAEKWYHTAVASGLFSEIFTMYRNLMSSPLPDGVLCRQRLGAIFKTIDRLNEEAVKKGRHRQPGHFFLAFVLVPWAEYHFDLFNRESKGKGFFLFSRLLREDICRTVAIDLNLKRSTRQEITILLTYLPVIARHEKANNWPKWLKEKSYFQSCRLLFHSLQEATRGIPVPSAVVAQNQETNERETVLTKKRRNGRFRKRGRPAFSRSNRGGIFGLKKE